MAKKNLKILLVCIVNRNFGDTIIADCTEYLINKALGDTAEDNTILRYKIDCGDLWQIQFADAIVFAGGSLIKFQQEKFYGHICDIIDEAQRLNIPVFMNSVGVEGFDEEDERCTMLRDHVNYECVKAVTVRDDFELMKSKYKTRSGLRVKKVFDPAIWVSDVYDKKAGNHKVVGVNVARGSLFPDYGNPQFDEEYMLNFWEKVIKLLEKKGLQWKVFTNGAKSDEAFAAKLMEKLGHGEKLAAPLDSRELVENIRGFSSIIATRMHACIVSCSLGIPCVGLVWNNKLRLWSKKIGAEAFYISPEDMSAQNVVNAMMEASEKGFKPLGFFKKFGVYHELKRFINKYAVNRYVGSDILTDKIIEVGLGGIQHKYKAPNSLDELERRLKEGCLFFEADVRADINGNAVCINGWSDKNVRMLGLEPKNGKRKEYSADELKKSLFDGTYKVGSFKEAADLIANVNRTKLVIDVGLPPVKLREALFADIAAVLKKYIMDNGNSCIRLQREEDVELWKKQDCGCEIIYFYPDDGETEEAKAKQEDALSVCSKHGISLISVNQKTFTDETAKIMKEKELLPVVFSYEKLGAAAEAAQRGAHFIGSFFYSSDYVKKLTSK